MRIGPGTYELAVLLSMQRRPQYGGTVPPAEVQRRRERNRQARRSRRVNRAGR